MSLHTRKHARNGHALSSDWAQIKHALNNTVDDVKGEARDRFLDSLDDLKSRSDKVHKNVSNYTSKKPLKSLGIALLVGVAVGFLIRR